MGHMKGEYVNMKNSESSRSWFCVLNNPSKIFGDEVEPVTMVDLAIERWCKDKPQRTCAINYEIGDSGTPHMHMVLEDPSKTRFSTVQKLFPSVHIEPTRGTKEQAEDYINKRGKFNEKDHTVIVPVVYRGSIKASQGVRNDLIIIEELIEQGKKPSEIVAISLSIRKQDALVRKAYFAKRYKETPVLRQVKVYWHVGDSGSGKSYTYIQLIEKYSTDDVYLMTDYDGGGFDNYEGQSVLFMDEFKGSMKFQVLLNYLDSYRIQIHCRYANTYALWTEVHITSIYPPEEAYTFMVNIENRERDRIDQLKRRLTKIIYHYKDSTGYKTYEMNSAEYSNLENLKEKAQIQADFQPLTDDNEIPFV